MLVTTKIYEEIFKRCNNSFKYSFWSFGSRICIYILSHIRANIGMFTADESLQGRSAWEKECCQMRHGLRFRLVSSFICLLYHLLNIRLFNSLPLQFLTIVEECNTTTGHSVILLLPSFSAGPSLYFPKKVSEANKPLIRMGKEEGGEVNGGGEKDRNGFG